MGCWKSLLAGSWQKDDRQEKRIRRLGSDIPAVSLHLYSFQNSLRWKWNYNSWQTEIGGQIMFIDNHSRAGTGVVPVIPNYTETQAGIYGIGKYNYSKGGVEAGVRFDGQETRASGYDWTGNPMGEQESSITYHTVWEPSPFFRTLETYHQFRDGLEGPPRV